MKTKKDRWVVRVLQRNRINGKRRCMFLCINMQGYLWDKLKRSAAREFTVAVYTMNQPKSWKPQNARHQSLRLRRSGCSLESPWDASVWKSWRRAARCPEGLAMERDSAAQAGEGFPNTGHRPLPLFVLSGLQTYWAAPPTIRQASPPVSWPMASHLLEHPQTCHEMCLSNLLGVP